MPVIQARVSELEESIIKDLAKREKMSVSELLRKSVLDCAVLDSRTSMYGSMVDNLVVADDFDAPLEDFAEYM